MTYPHNAGWSEPTTSKMAAEKIEASGRAKTIREKVSDLFACGNFTAYEAAEALSVPFHSVQPRISELAKSGVLEHHKQVDGPYGTRIWKWKMVRN